MGKSDRIQRRHEEEEVKLAEKKKLEADSKKRSKITRNIIIVAASAVAAVAIFWGIMTGSGLMQQSITALNVNGTNITAAEYNYYYMSTIMDFQQRYSSSLLQSYGLDFTLPLSSQMFDEKTTWEDYFAERATDEVKNVVVLSEQAKKEGMSLTEADKVSVQAFMDSLTESSDGESLNKLLPRVFGKGTTEKNLRATRERYQLAQRYIMTLMENAQVTDEEITARYEQAPNDYDVADFWAFNIDFSNSELEGDALEAFKAEKEQIAKDMVERINAGESLAEIAAEYAPEDQKADYADMNKTLTTGVSKLVAAQINADMADWLFEAARAEGDAGYFTSGTTFVVAEFGQRYREEYTTKSVRHILITPVADASGAVTDEIHVKTRALANEVLDEYKAGGATDELFATLAAKYSDDTATATTGGLYKSVSKGEMVPEFEEWTFNPDRKAGDTEIIRSDYGYHIMLYVGDNLPAWKSKAETDIINEKVDANYAEWEAAAVVKVNPLGMSITKN